LYNPFVKISIIGNICIDQGITDMAKSYNFAPQKHESELRSILLEVNDTDKINRKKLTAIIKKYPKNGNSLFAKDELVQGYYYLKENGELEEARGLLNKIKMKPTRTISGVTPLTVLTRPFPCPGKCIFCPNDVRMPKSYLSDEPGAQRAERNNFDPYLQTYNRLQAFRNTGHEVAKVELIILGGTWSYYPEAYQIWFIKRCFEAMNDFGAKRDKREAIKTANIYEQKAKTKNETDDKGRRKSYNRRIVEAEIKAAREAGIEGPINIHRDYSARINREVAGWDDLFEQQEINVSAKVRCVGLVIETRPDHIDEDEVVRVRKLGATKTQIGYQSLQDEVLELNKRGHDVAATERSVSLVRSAGFKIHIHWMPNLYGSTPEKDKQDYMKLFEKGFVPDEVKIYPCSLIETAELMDYYEKGLWKPYTEQELLDVLTFCIENTPRYVRLTRVIRDIPSQDIVEGNKKTNFRQIVENELERRGSVMQDIRSREIRDQQVEADELQLKITDFTGQNVWGETDEKFIEFVNREDKICGFLRLSLPKKSGQHFISELANAAIIREVHVYGVSQKIGGRGKRGSSQHLGLGKKLIEKSKQLAKESGFDRLAVISAIGTKEYYRKRSFEDQGLYQVCEL
jgi:elongator complex protein 3